MVNTRAALEAILFVAESPIPEGELAEVLEQPVADVRTELGVWAAGLAADDRGITLRNVAGGWRLYTKPEAFPYLERFSAAATASRLSGAALEVLAVVAYRQPVSRGQIAELRGVDSESTVRTLERRGLIGSRLGEPSPERGGRAKRFYQLHPPGVIALQESRIALAALWDDVDLGPETSRS